MPRCSIPECKNSSVKGMYRLPTNPVRRQEWYSRLLPPNGRMFNISYVCAAHFEPDMWENNWSNGPRRRLKVHAVPSLSGFNLNKTVTEPHFNGIRTDIEAVNGYNGSAQPSCQMSTEHSETNSNGFLMQTEEVRANHLTSTSRENEMETETVMEIIYIPENNGMEMTTFTEEITETSIADELLNTIDLVNDENDTLPHTVNQHNTTSNNKALRLPKTNIHIESGVHGNASTVNKELDSEIGGESSSPSNCKLITCTDSEPMSSPRSHLKIRSRLFRKGFDQNVCLEIGTCDKASTSSQSVTDTNELLTSSKAKIRIKSGGFKNDVNQKQVAAHINNKPPHSVTPKIRMKPGLLEKISFKNKQVLKFIINFLAVLNPK